MDAFRDFDEIAALSSVGVTRASLVRMLTQEHEQNAALAERGQSWRFDGDGCALEVARGGAMPTMISHWIAATCSKLRAMLSRPVVPAR